MKHKLPILFPIILFCLCGAIPLQATTYTVKAGGGGNYTTISACAAAATAGDTCQIYAGSYAGWTQSHNGSPGSPITFISNTGDTVNISGNVTISGNSYITISGFHFTSGGVVGSSSSTHNIISHNSFVGNGAFTIPHNTGSGGAFNYIGYNVVNLTGTTDVNGMDVYGDNNLMEHNEVYGGDADCHDIGGTNVIVRYEYCHDMVGPAQHIDFVQVVGAGYTPTLVSSLIEHNIERNCTNDGGNCHFLIIRTGGTPAANGVIARFNYVQNMDGMGFDIGGSGDSVTNTWLYNNTVATEAKSSSDSGNCALIYSDNGTLVHAALLNNICYNDSASNRSPIIGQNAGDIALENYNLAYTAGASSFIAPYSSEATYSALQSKNPLFANYPTDGTLGGTSPALTAGTYLTTTSNTGSNSTTLVVGNAYGFQSGWAGTQADWIRIGASTTVQISSINYATNVITLASPASWTSGTGVYLYKDSSGNIVLNGTNPDLGAYPHQSGNAGNPAPPTNLSASVQ